MAAQLYFGFILFLKSIWELLTRFKSLAYIISIVGAYYIFNNESLSALKIIGCLLILAGVACIGLSTRYS